MKKALLSITLIGTIAALFIVSCSKTYNRGTTTQSLNQLFAGLRSTPQTITVTAGRDAIVYAPKGTRLHFYPNSFKDANGNTISGGIVTLQIVEMYTPGDMIANRATTMVGDQIILSSGQVNIVATMNGQPVYTNGYGIAFKHSVSSTDAMALFYGSTRTPDSAVTWTLSDTTLKGKTTVGTKVDTAATNPIFFFFDTCNSFTYANCDWFSNNDSPRTTVSVVLPNGTFNPANTSIFVVLPAYSMGKDITGNYVAVLTSDYGRNGYNAATNTMQLISGIYTNVVPAGANYELVVISNINGQYYYWKTSGVMPHNGVIVNAVPTPDTEGDILSKLAGL